MLTFAIRGRVADVDATCVGEALHPSPVLLVEAGEAIVRVVVPGHLLAGAQDVPRVGALVCVHGRIHGFPRQAEHVATTLQATRPLH